METKRTTPERPPCPSWCTARHADLARAVWVTHTADLATSTAQGQRLTVRLVWSEGRDGAPSDNPRVLLLVTQEDGHRSEPLPPGLLQLDPRQARDWARCLTAATGLTWLADTLERAANLLEAERAGAAK